MGLFSSKKKGQGPKNVAASEPLSEPLQDAVSGVAAVRPTASQAFADAVTSQPAATAAAPAQIVNDRLTLLGKLIRLMSLAPEFRKMSLGEIDAMITPAITMGQVLIAETQAQDGKAAPAPAAFALWASVSPEIDQRLSTELDQPWGLAAPDWKSGDIPWLILAVGDERVVSALLNAFITQTLGGKELKMRGRDASGKMIATAIRVTPAQSAQ